MHHLHPSNTQQYSALKNTPLQRSLMFMLSGLQVRHIQGDREPQCHVLCMPPFAAGAAKRLTLGYMVLSPLALSLPQDTSCSPIIVQKLDVAPHAACTHRHLSAFMRLSKHAAEALRPHPVHGMPPLHHEE